MPLERKIKSTWIIEALNQHDAPNSRDAYTWSERWFGDCTTAVDDFLDKTESCLSKAPYTPSPKNVLRFMKMNPKDVKVVILGQDPYPAKGQATGRSFEIGGSERSGFREQLESVGKAGATLLNLLYVIASQEPLKPKSVTKKAKIDKIVDRLKFDSIEDFFTKTEARGVLWLNTYLTHGTNLEGSHKSKWKWKCPCKKSIGPFALTILRKLESSKSGVNPCYMVWGAESMKTVKRLFDDATPEKLLGKRVFCSSHPSSQGFYQCLEKYPSFGDIHETFVTIAKNLGQFDLWTSGKRP